jgi:hypothetical protein
MLNDFHYNLLDVANNNNLLDHGGKSKNNKNSI